MRRIEWGRWSVRRKRLQCSAARIWATSQQFARIPAPEKSSSTYSPHTSACAFNNVSLLWQTVLPGPSTAASSASGLECYTKPSKLLTSTVTHNFDRGSQIFKKIVGTLRLKKGILSQKLSSLKNCWKCPKKCMMVVTLCFLHFSLCWF